MYMKNKYHLRPWELQWHKFLRESKFVLRLLQRLPERLISNIPYEALPLWVAAAITGIAAVFYEKLFGMIEKASEAIFHYNPYLIFLISPLCFLGGWYLVMRFGKTAGGSGIPQLMASVELAETKHAPYVDKLLNLRVIVVKIASSLLMLLGGGAIGREGPTLQIAGSIFESVYRLIPETWAKVSQKIMIITGGASGLAAAFNTPLGGIVYVVEELTKSHIGQFRTAVFSAVIISGFAAQLFLGSYLYLGFPKISPVPFTGLLWVVLLSLISGYFGALFSRILLYIAHLRTKIKKNAYRYIFVIILGLLFASLVFFSGNLAMGSGKPLMNAILFDNKTLPWYMFPMRFVGAALTFTVGGAGGIFATSLASGAALGDLMANLLQVPASYHNLLVLVSMIGFLTGVTRSPFTAAILVLEMTDRHSAIFYFLLAGMMANLAASRLMVKSIYEIQRDQILETCRSKTKV